ncbi:hypothetical protein [Rhizobium leguminosarum]|uniref:hypothetical protein n=1 Tax=Rhizobium leguminosarum TaxID=384 RepID=UPI002E15396D|nr:hypothetical protein U8Q02_39450 [Rhizobium leguminosarum]
MKVKHKIDLLKEERLRLETRKDETVPMLGIAVHSDEEIDAMRRRIREIDVELYAIRAITGIF